MYCTNCTTAFAFLLNEPENYHRNKVEVALHDGLFSLERSAAAGCRCCRLLRHALLAQENNLEYSPHLNQDAEIKLVRERKHFESERKVQVLVRLQILNWEQPLVIFYEKFHERFSDSVRERNPSSSVDNDATNDSLSPDWTFGEDSDAIFHLMRKWLHTCETTHGGFCISGIVESTEAASPSLQVTGREQLNVRENPQVPFLPTRLIEITRKENGTFRLRLTLSREVSPADRGHHHQGYTTLSYCWGKYTNFFTTTQQNYRDHLQDIAFEALPKTFKHAIIITYNLGLRHIWIDALCIIQPTKDNSTDWDIEAGRMLDVYRSSSVTISATSATDVQKGCFYDRPALLYPVSPCPLPDLCGREFDLSSKEAKQPILKIERPIWHPNVELAPVAKRGWIFQERMLSRRTIYCTTQAVFWECAELKASEYEPLGCVSTSYARRHLRDILDTKNPGRDWSRLIEEYSSRRLTVQSDKLPALSGIAQTFHRIRADSYLAGMWRRDLPEALGWGTLVYSYDKDIGSLARTPGIPSWSWASVKTSIDFNIFFNVSQHEFGERGDCALRVVDGASTLAGPDPFGRVTDGYLRVHGRLRYVDMQGVDPQKVLTDDAVVNYVEPAEGLVLYVDEPRWLLQEHLSRIKVPCICLYQGPSRPWRQTRVLQDSLWLALEATPGSGGRRYSRIGLLTQRRIAEPEELHDEGEAVDIELI